MKRLTLALCLVLLGGCNTPAVITLPDGNQVDAGKSAAEDLTKLPPAEERIRVGDTLRIVRTSGEMPSISAFTANSIYELTLYTVMNDGTFQYPFIGTVKAAGKTTAQLAEEIRGRHAAFYQEPRVTVNINQSPGNTVFVGGAVRNPSPLPFPVAPTLEQAIIGAGGIMMDADSSNVALLRMDEEGQYKTYFIDYGKLMHGGIEGRMAVALQRGDVVFVPKSGIGNRVEGVELYLNQLIPFVKTLGIGFNYDLKNNY
jgi:protein involved in polysaccharide export with SLBB domain